MLRRGYVLFPVTFVTLFVLCGHILLSPSVSSIDAACLERSAHPLVRLTKVTASERIEDFSCTLQHLLADCSAASGWRLTRSRPSFCRGVRPADFRLLASSSLQRGRPGS